MVHTRFGSNFNDFINHYRIQESKRLLLDPSFRHHTNAAIAYASGFTSRTSFNSAFKKNYRSNPIGLPKNEEQMIIYNNEMIILKDNTW